MDRTWRRARVINSRHRGCTYMHGALYCIRRWWSRRPLSSAAFASPAMTSASRRTRPRNPTWDVRSALRSTNPLCALRISGPNALSVAWRALAVGRAMAVLHGCRRLAGSHRRALQSSVALSSSAKKKRRRKLVPLRRPRSCALVRLKPESKSRRGDGEACLFGTAGARV